MLQVFVFSFCLSFVIGVQLQYRSCGSSADVHSIILEPCDYENCTILQGHTYNATVNFTARMHHEKALNHCYGTIAGIRQEFGTIEREACGNGMTCPIEPGVAQIYRASVTCPITDPKRMVARWEVKDEHDQIIICFYFPVIIQ